MRTRVVLAIAVLLMVVATTGCSPDKDNMPSSTGPDPLVVFLVRHGEKTGPGEDPELSAAGRERAGALADTLRSAEIRYIHSSDFNRTRDTAKPVALDHRLEVKLYDPDNLSVLVEELHRAGGRHLVVGHSNTTPAMIRLLGGDPGPPIDEKNEHDRLYVMTVGEDGSVSGVLMRYGKINSSGDNE